jgi:hypothetical protein
MPFQLCNCLFQQRIIKTNEKPIDKVPLKMRAVRGSDASYHRGAGNRENLARGSHRKVGKSASSLQVNLVSPNII